MRGSDAQEWLEGLGTNAQSEKMQGLMTKGMAPTPDIYDGLRADR